MKKNKHCKICDKLIWETAFYCIQCFAKKRAKIYKGSKNPNYKNGRPRCINCNKLLSRYDAKRCGKCYQIYKKGKNHPSYKDGRTLKKYYCINCNKKLSDYKAVRCDSCKQIGKLNNNYYNGQSYFPYPIEFNKELKFKIRKRDNYQCQNCNITEEEHITVYGRVLDIHHIDYNKTNCAENNLITLCQHCNLRANYNRKYWEKYYRERIFQCV